MAVLTTAQRSLVSFLLQDRLSSRREGIGSLTKADILAAINATDTWIENNAAAYNTALPAAARTALTAQQKLELFHLVSLTRFGG